MQASPNGTARLSAWVSIAAVIAPAMGAVFYIGFLSKANNDAVAAQQDVNRGFGTEIRQAREKMAAIERDLNEIETQFCAQDNLRNEMHARDLRDFAVLWEHVYGSRYPIDNAFYARVCNRRAGKND